MPGTDRFSDLERHPDNERMPDALIVRAESGLFYFNVGHVRDEVRRHLAAAGPGVAVVVWDLSSSPGVDIAGTRLVDARASVRELLRAALGEDAVAIDRRRSIADACDLSTTRE